MDRATFEAAIGVNRFVNPKSNLQLTLIFAKEYVAEDFIKLANTGAQTSLLIDKMPTGASSSVYSVNLFSGGYVKANVSDQSPGGKTMNPVEEYFSQHPTQLRLFKYGVVALVPFGTVIAIDYIQTTEWAIKATLIAAITGLNIYVSKLNPEQKWDGVGTRLH